MPYLSLYFLPSSVVVLSVSLSRVSAPDMGRDYARTQRYRIELYTKTKADTLRERFKDLIYSTIPAGEFDEEEVSYSSDRLYLTAIEFEIME